MPRTAKLLFDSAARAGMPGMRAMTGNERSLLFKVDDYALDLVVFESAGLKVVHGQLVSTASDEGIAQAKVQLGEDGDVVETDHFGQFSLSTMTPLDGEVLCAFADDVEIACPMPMLGAA